MQWWYNKKLPIEAKTGLDDKGHPTISIKWKQTYGGEIELSYGFNPPTEASDLKKMITVASLF